MKLELNRICKSFGDKEVLKGISLEVESGHAMGLLGRNGAGKTTTIRILMDVFPADSGTVQIDGQPVDYGKTGMGYLPEERGLYPKKKIIDQLVYFAQLKGMNKADAVRASDHWLKRIGMSEYRNKRLDTLSKGNQQKIQLITAVVHDPDIVILDEPFSGLDPVNAMMLEDVVKEEIKRGKIVLFSSHQMNYIEEFCEQIAILNNGILAVCGNLHEIKRNYKRDRLQVRSEQSAQIMRELGVRCTIMENGELMIHLKSPEEKPAVMKQLTEHYDIDGIRVFEPSLNDIFVQYAGEKKQEEQA